MRNCDFRRGFFSLWPTCSVCSMHTYYCLDFFRSEVFLGFEMPSDTEPCAHLVYVGLPFFLFLRGRDPAPDYIGGLSVGMLLIGALLPFSNLGIRVSSFLPILAPN